MATDTLEKPKVDGTDTNNGDKVAHMVKKKEMTDAAVFGTPIRALCGYTFVPSQMPKGDPCPKCKEVYEQLPP